MRSKIIPSAHRSCRATASLAIAPALWKALGRLYLRTAKFVFFAFVAAAGVFPLVAQTPVDSSESANAPLTINVSTEHVAVGEIGQLFIKVRDADVALPERIDVVGLEIVYSGSQSSNNIVKGAQTTETTHFYRFHGDEPGSYTIPELEILLSNRQGKHVAKTRPIVVTVTSRPTADSIAESKIYGVDDYNKRLHSLTNDIEFRSLSQTERGAILAKFRDEYSKNLTNEEDIAIISSLTKHESDYTKGKRYRITPDAVKNAELTFPETTNKTKEESLRNIQLFRASVDEKAGAFDELFREDFVFDLNRIVDVAEREVRGRQTGVFSDKINRIFQGMTGGTLRLMGQGELAVQFETKFFPENPEFDGDFLSKVACPFRSKDLHEKIADYSQSVPANQLTYMENASAKGLAASILIAIVFVSLSLRLKAVSRNVMAASAPQKDEC